MEFYYKTTDVSLLKDIWDQHPELYGKEEIWKPLTKDAIKEAKEGIYFVSNYGRIYSIISNKFMTPVKTKNGYYRVSILYDNGDRRYQLLHRIVMMTFYPIPNADLFQVNHIDGNKSHNWYWNLEWVTCAENRAHAINTGLVKIQGQEHPMHKIDNNTAEKIAQMLSSTNMTAKEIANVVGCGATERIAFNIMNGNSWDYLYKKYNLENISRNPPVMTDIEMHKTCQYIEFVKKNFEIGFGCRSRVLEDAILYAGCDINNSTKLLAERLFYKLTHKEICKLYDY